MLLPASASLRCLNALRYLVRSYVTSPTTIRAITEIPAKTPRPMGRTESFFPGSVNVAVDEACSAAASDAIDAADEEDDAAAAAAAAVADEGLMFVTAELMVGDDVATTGGGVTGVVAEVGVAELVEGAGTIVEGAGTIERPFTLTAGTMVEVGAAFARLDEDGATESVAVTVTCVEAEIGDAVAVIICEGA